MKKFGKTLSIGLATIMAVSSLGIGTTAFASQVNSVQTAESIGLNETKSAVFRYGEINDDFLSENTKYFKFVAPTTSYYEFNLTGYQNRIDGQNTTAYIDVTDTTGKSVDSGGYYDQYYNDVKAVAELAQGQTYYIESYYSPFKTVDYENNGYAESTINISVTPHTHEFSAEAYSTTTYYTCNRCHYSYSEENKKSISNIYLEKIKYVYDGKLKTPNVIAYDTAGNLVNLTNVSYASGRKNVGTYNVSVTYGKQSFNLSFQIVPKRTNISSVKAGKKKLTLKWKKQQKQATGYQIQYSTSKKFSRAKTITVKSKITSKTIKGLKAKKKYYVRIRTYKVVNGKKLASSWSKTKSIKTK